MKDKQCEQTSSWFYLLNKLPLFKVADVYKNKFLEDWAAITKLRKPLIAAVSGYAVSARKPYVF